MKTATNSSIDNGVYNDGAYIKIVFDGGIIQVNKSQIKTIDTVRNDVVRIDIGAGAMKNIYLRLSEVQYPQVFENVTVLRNYNKDLMLQNNFATVAKQDETIVELKSIKHLLLDIKQLLIKQKGEVKAAAV